MAKNANAINYFSPAKWVVSTVAGEGTHTTIASALSSASSGDTIVIMPGTFTENPTLKAGVNLTAFPSDSSVNQTGNVIINGNCTLTDAGTVTISGIQLQTNSAALLTVSGSAASIVNLVNCNLNFSNNTGITFSTSSGSGAVNIYSCTGDIGTTGIAPFTHTSAGTLSIFNSDFTNSGASTTASTASAGSINIGFCYMKSAISTSSTNAFNANQLNIDCSAINTTALTVGGSGTNGVNNSAFASGTASAVSIGGTCGLAFTVISSSNTNAVTGAGTVVVNTISFTGSSSLINTTTKTEKNFATGGISFDAGTTYLSNYAVGTFTPTMIGSSTAGTTTYSLQNGYYTSIGNMAFIQGNVQGSAATGTGNISYAGLPFTIKNQSNGSPYGPLQQGGALTWVASTTSTTIQGGINTTQGAAACCGSGAAGGLQAIANSAFHAQYSLAHQF